MCKEINHEAISNPNDWYSNHAWTILTWQTRKVNSNQNCAFNSICETKKLFLSSISFTWKVKCMLVVEDVILVPFCTHTCSIFLYVITMGIKSLIEWVITAVEAECNSH